MTSREALIERAMVARSAAGEYVRASARASGSVTRLWRLREGDFCIHKDALPLVHQTTSPPPHPVASGCLGTLPTASPLPCGVCSAPGSVVQPQFLCHTASPYWLVCPQCLPAAASGV